ncbi:MAG: sulfur carrier protein ThiS [PVC group bacterium]
MNISLNGKQREVEADLSLSGLLKELKLSPDTLCVEHNGRIVHREHFHKIVLKDGDALELVRFVGGG